MTVLCLAVDPGINGAVGWTAPDGTADAIDTPTIKVRCAGRTKSGKPRQRSQYNEQVIVEYLLAVKQQAQDAGMLLRAIIEDVHAMPTDGAVGAFSFGESKGIWRGMLAMACIPYEMVSPATWRPAMVGKGADKEAARVLAQRLFPEVPLKLKKDHNRAEALLMAEYLRRRLTGAYKNPVKPPRPPRTRKALIRDEKGFLG